MHTENFLPGWGSINAVRSIHNSLEAAALIFFAALVGFDILAHIADENRRRAKRLEKLGLMWFAIAVLAEILAYPYSRRNDAFSSQQDMAQREKIASLENSTQKLKTEAAEAIKRAAEAQEKALALQATVTPLDLSDEQQSAIAAACKRYSGRTVMVTCNNLDIEGRILAGLIITALKHAGIKAYPDPRNSVTFSGLGPGLTIDGPDKQFVETLRSSLDKFGYLNIVIQPVPVIQRVLKTENGGLEMEKIPPPRETVISVGVYPFKKPPN